MAAKRRRSGNNQQHNEGNTQVSEGTTFSYNPEASKRAFLPNAGTYGPGCENEADCTVFEVRPPRPDTPEAPYEDKDCSKDPGGYTLWVVQVIFNDMVVFAQSRAQPNTLPNSGSKNLAWFANLGMEPTAEDSNGNPAFDLATLAGKKCRIRVGKPNESKKDPGTWYSGTLVDVFSAEDNA